MLAIDEVATRHRFTADEFHRMGEVGLLPPEMRLELVDGELIEMSPPGIPHSGSIGLLTRRLVLACGERAMVWVQNPLRLSPFTELMPDFIVLKAAPDEYLTHRPLPEDVLLVVEVSDTSLRYDREIKRRHYARHGVPEYWIFDVRGRRVEVWWEPKGEAFRRYESIDSPGPRPLSARRDIVVDLTGALPPPGAAID